MSNSAETILNNRYALESQLASGGMAVVYKATDRSLGRRVAVKVLRPSLTTDPAFIARFQYEAQSIARLSHPNIVIVFDVGDDGATYYIVMELVEGSDLKRMIRTHGQLELSRALEFGIQICDGIGFAHRSRIVHADIKPQNVLLNSSNTVKITDFGIAQALTDTQPQTRASVVWGSPHYFAPEQAQGEKPTAASDVYSIGVVLFEMLTGRLPFTGASQQDLAMAHIQVPVPDVREFNKDVPEELAFQVKKAMSKRPNDRYGDADKLGTNLKRIRDQMNAATYMRKRPPISSPEERSTPAPPQNLPQTGANPPQGQLDNEQNPHALPTQRYSIAPEMPPNYAPQRDQQQQVPPPPGQSVQHPRAFTMSPKQQMGADSRPLASSQPYRPYQEGDEAFNWDGVTIALGVLAMMAVACLIPLYIVALQARLG